MGREGSRRPAAVSLALCALSLCLHLAKPQEPNETNLSQKKTPKLILAPINKPSLKITFDSFPEKKSGTLSKIFHDKAATSDNKEKPNDNKVIIITSKISNHKSKPINNKVQINNNKPKISNDKGKINSDQVKLNNDKPVSNNDKAKANNNKAEEALLQDEIAVLKETQPKGDDFRSQSQNSEPKFPASDMNKMGADSNSGHKSPEWSPPSMEDNPIRTDTSNATDNKLGAVEDPDEIRMRAMEHVRYIMLTSALSVMAVVVLVLGMGASIARRRRRRLYERCSSLGDNSLMKSNFKLVSHDEKLSVLNAPRYSM